MKFSTTAVVTLLSATASLATPTTMSTTIRPNSASTSTSTKATSTPSNSFGSAVPNLFRLKIVTRPGASTTAPDVNGLYFHEEYAESTGSEGFEDIDFFDASSAGRLYLNGTQLQSWDGPGSQYYLNLPTAELSADFWYATIVYAQPASGKFSFNATGLQYDDYLFNGWRVCNWWRDGWPQLFWKSTFAGEPSYMPSNCVDVDLVREYTFATAK